MTDKEYNSKISILEKELSTLSIYSTNEEIKIMNDIFDRLCALRRAVIS